MLQRETNYNLSRSAKRARMASSIPIVALLLVGGMAVAMLCPVGRMVNKAQATDGGVVTLSSYLPSSVTLTLSDKVEGEIEPKANGTFSSISTIARVQVNNSDQYSVLISGEADMTNKTQAANDAKISSVDGVTSGTDFKANTWGYNVVEGKNTTAGESAIYSPVGEAKVVSTKLLKDTKGADDYYTLSFGAKVDTSIPAGTYSSTVTLSVVASPKQVTGFDRTDTMQGMTASICKEIGSELDLQSGGADKYAATDSLGNTYYTKRLKDLRDGKYYWVAKLADGNCWMTQNLDYEIPGMETPFGVARETDGGYFWGGELEVMDSLDNSKITLVNASWTVSDDVNFYAKNDGSAVNTEEQVYDAHYTIGNYYQASAARSACPNEWSLPTAGQTNDTNGSYNKLVNGYSAGNDSWLLEAPYLFTHTGYVDHITGSRDDLGGGCHYWSSTPSTELTNGYYYLFSGNMHINPFASSYDYYGNSVRCLVKID